MRVFMHRELLENQLWFVCLSIIVPRYFCTQIFKIVRADLLNSRLTQSTPTHTQSHQADTHTQMNPYTHIH